jgi:hypothetical protein
MKAAAAGTFCLAVLAACTTNALRTVEPPLPGIIRACGTALLNPFRLHIDLADPDQVWGTYESDGRRFEITWPPGFSLRTVPDPAVLDPSGNVVGRDGQVIEDAGGGGGVGGPEVICSIGGTSYPLD